MKEEFQNDKELVEQLNAYKVHIPKDKLEMKQTSWQRFIRYLASPAPDPLHKVTESLGGLRLAQAIPLGTGIVIALIQMVVMMNN